MPAINLFRLRQQIKQLEESFDNPVEFKRTLYNLLDTYADRAHRPGRAGEPPPISKTFNVPPPVIREISIKVRSLATSDPNKTIQLAQALWADPYFEFKHIAAILLGCALPDPLDPVLEIVESWLAAAPDEHTVNSITKYALAGVQRDAPELLLLRLESWLASEEIKWQRTGLQVLQSFPADAMRLHLPVMLQLITPHIRKARFEIRPDLLGVLQALANCSPKETAYFLKQTLETSHSPDVPMLVRQLLSAFPPDLQEDLQTTLKAHLENRVEKSHHRANHAS